MELLIRFSAAAALITAVCLLLRRSNPELQVPLAAAGCAFVLLGTLKLLSPVREFLERAAALSGLSYSIPESVRTIGVYAFAENASLTEVSINEEYTLSILRYAIV